MPHFQQDITQCRRTSLNKFQSGCSSSSIWELQTKILYISKGVLRLRFNDHKFLEKIIVVPDNSKVVCKNVALIGSISAPGTAVLFANRRINYDYDSKYSRMKARNAWCTYLSGDPYVQVSMNTYVTASSMIMQGDKSSKAYVTSFIVRYYANSVWKFYNESGPVVSASDASVLIGNKDSADRIVRIFFKWKITFSKFRVYPLDYEGNAACMQWDLLADTGDDLPISSVCGYTREISPIVIPKTTIESEGDMIISQSGNYRLVFRGRGDHEEETSLDLDKVAMGLERILLPILGNDFKCESCVPGKYSEERGAAFCKLCGIGRFSSVFESTSESNCNDCPANTFTQVPNTGIVLSAATSRDQCHNCSVMPNPADAPRKFCSIPKPQIQFEVLVILCFVTLAGMAFCFLKRNEIARAGSRVFGSTAANETVLATSNASDIRLEKQDSLQYASVVGESELVSLSSWNCPRCTHDNGIASGMCAMCGYNKLA